MIVINKIDLLEKGDEIKDRIITKLKRRFIFVPWAPLLFVSAKNKKNTYEILNQADEIIKEREKRIPTAALNSFFQKITQKHLPASRKIRKPKFMYGSQVEIAPPKFVMFFKNAKDLHFSYPRYLENEIRKEYGFNGTAINIRFKSKDITESAAERISRKG
ncbi:MAG: ribosome biogenesis GTPase Der, partial [bacterium]|nr:ribosome biogenesis GTPase Der [bacterium]